MVPFTLCCEHLIKANGAGKEVKHLPLLRQMENCEPLFDWEQLSMISSLCKLM